MQIFTRRQGALLCFWLSGLFVVIGFCYADLSTVEVVGLGECTDCKENNIKTSRAFSGLRVTVDCKAANGHFETREAGDLDKNGNFRVSLPHEIVKDGELKEECYAQLHSASAAPCPAHDGLYYSKIVIKSKTGDKHTLGPAGKLKFSSATCTSAFFWPFFKHPLLPKLPPHPHFSFPPKVFPPFPPEFFPKHPLFPPVPIYKKPLPPPVPIYKAPPPPPVPVYKKPLPPPVPIYKKPLPPPVPVSKKPLPPTVPIVKKPCPPKVKKPRPPLVPIVKKPCPLPKVKKPLPPPIPIFKPLPPTSPIHKIPFFKSLPPFPKLPPFKKPPCPPLPPFPKLPPLKKPPKYFFHHPKFGKWPFPPLPPFVPHP